MTKKFTTKVENMETFCLISNEAAYMLCYVMSDTFDSRQLSSHFVNLLFSFVQFTATCITSMSFWSHLLFTLPTSPRW